AAQLVENGQDSPFYDAFESMPEAIPAAEQERLRRRAVTVIEEVIVPAYRRFGRYFEEAYLPASRDSVGASELPMAKSSMNSARGRTPRPRCPRRKYTASGWRKCAGYAARCSRSSTSWSSRANSANSCTSC